MNCKARQFIQGKPRQYLFFIRSPTPGEFNYVIQVDIAQHFQWNILKIIDKGTVYHNGVFITKIDDYTAWGSFPRFLVDLHAASSDFVHTDAIINFKSEISRKRWKNQKLSSRLLLRKGMVALVVQKEAIHISKSAYIGLVLIFFICHGSNDSRCHSERSMDLQAPIPVQLLRPQYIRSFPRYRAGVLV